jgi:hypothetical protein
MRGPARPPPGQAHGLQRDDAQDDDGDEVHRRAPVALDQLEGLDLGLVLRRAPAGRNGERGLLERHGHDSDAVPARAVGPDRVADHSFDAFEAHGRRGAQGLLVHQHRDGEARHGAHRGLALLRPARVLVGIADGGLRARGVGPGSGLTALLALEHLPVGVEGLHGLVHLVEAELGGDLGAGAARTEHRAKQSLDLLGEAPLGRPLELELARRQAGDGAGGGRHREHPPRVVHHRDVVARELLDAVADDVGDPLHGVGSEHDARLELEHDRSARGTLEAPQGAAGGHHEVHLGALDALQAADGAGQLAFEGPLEGHTLREVGHAPRRLVEELETRAPVLGQTVLRERDACARRLRDRHRHLRAAGLQPVEDATLAQPLRDDAGLVEVEFAVEGHVGRRRDPAARVPHATDQQSGHTERQEAPVATEAAHHARHGERHLVHRGRPGLIACSSPSDTPR